MPYSVDYTSSTYNRQLKQPYGAMKRKWTIEEVNRLARRHGGKCLSANCRNSSEKLNWECRAGHCWSATVNSVQQEHWCPTCVGNGKLTINDARRLAALRGGECVSTRYLNARTPLTWRCKEGHRLEADYDHVKRGQWCRKCAQNRKKLSVEYVATLARKRNGTCLASRPVGRSERVIWQCSDGHQFARSVREVLTGRWCPYAAGHRNDISAMRAIAVSRGGECLSRDSGKSTVPLRWRCANNHEFEMTPEKARQGRWCPYCTQSWGEVICRFAFQSIFGKPFPKRRPSWLLVPNMGARLELDGYCEDLKIAFEYNG
jgi:hypothetical protein